MASVDRPTASATAAISNGRRPLLFDGAATSDEFISPPHTGLAVRFEPSVRLKNNTCNRESIARMTAMLLERPPPFLVMAHHRSGSNFLNDVLQSCAGIECLNEPLSMHTRFFRDHDLAPWGADDHDPALLHASLGGDPTVREFLLELKAYLGQSRRG